MFKFFFLLFLLFSCSPNDPNLSNTSNSKEEVIQKAFEYVSTGNRKGLDSLLLTRKEHNENFWNHVGERFTSDPSITADFAYNQMNLETNFAKPQLEKELYGKQLKIQSIGCNRMEEYGQYKLHLGCKVIAMYPNGTLLEINGFRTVIELNGKYKIYHLKRE